MLVAQSSPNRRDPMDCGPPGSSVHRILQARRLEWVAIPFSGVLPDQRIEPRPPAGLQADSLPSKLLCYLPQSKVKLPKTSTELRFEGGLERRGEVDAASTQVSRAAGQPSHQQQVLGCDPDSVGEGIVILIFHKLLGVGGPHFDLKG